MTGLRHPWRPFPESHCGESPGRSAMPTKGAGEMVDAKPRRFWRNSPADAILLAITLTQFSGTIALAALPPDGLWPRLASAALVTAVMTYSIIVVTHLFVH